MVKTFSFKEKNNGSNPFFSTEKEPSKNKKFNIDIFIDKKLQIICNRSKTTIKHMMIKLCQIIKKIKISFKITQKNIEVMIFNRCYSES